MHLSKLECQDKNSEGLYCKHGCFKAVNPGCHIELDNSEMFMPQIEFPTPTNFVCRKCVDASEIAAEIFLRQSSAKTILNDLAVSDVIVCATSLRKKVLRKLKGSGRKVHVYN